MYMTARTKVFHNPAFVKFDWIWFLSSMVRLRRFNILIKLYYNCKVFGHHLADSTRKYLLCCWLAGLCVACSWSPGLSASSESVRLNRMTITKVVLPRVVSKWCLNAWKFMKVMQQFSVPQFTWKFIYIAYTRSLCESSSLWEVAV